MATPKTLAELPHDHPLHQFLEQFRSHILELKDGFFNSVDYIQDEWGYEVDALASKSSSEDEAKFDGWGGWNMEKLKAANFFKQKFGVTPAQCARQAPQGG